MYYEEAWCWKSYSREHATIARDDDYCMMMMVMMLLMGMMMVLMIMVTIMLMTTVLMMKTYRVTVRLQVLCSPCSGLFRLELAAIWAPRTTISINTEGGPGIAT